MAIRETASLHADESVNNQDETTDGTGLLNNCSPTRADAAHFGHLITPGPVTRSFCAQAGQAVTSEDRVGWAPRGSCGRMPRGPSISRRSVARPSSSWLAESVPESTRPEPAASSQFAFAASWSESRISRSSVTTSDSDEAGLAGAAEGTPGRRKRERRLAILDQSDLAFWFISPTVWPATSR